MDCSRPASRRGCVFVVHQYLRSRFRGFWGRAPTPPRLTCPFVLENSYQQIVCSSLRQALLTTQKRSGLAERPVNLLDFIHNSIFARRLLALPGPGLALYKKCIQLESLASTDGAATSMAAVRPLFEAALEVHSQAWELWLEYCKQEMRVSPSRGAPTEYSVESSSRILMFGRCKTVYISFNSVLGSVVRR